MHHLQPYKCQDKCQSGLQVSEISIIPDTAKYSDLNPRIAKIFDVYTMNRSWLTARTAGMLSTANKRSVDSIINNTKNRGVT